jgi:hypothetical protein
MRPRRCALPPRARVGGRTPHPHPARRLDRASRTRERASGRQRPSASAGWRAGCRRGRGPGPAGQRRVLRMRLRARVPRSRTHEHRNRARARAPRAGAPPDHCTSVSHLSAGT